MLANGLALTAIAARRSGPTYPDYAFALDFRQGRYRQGQVLASKPDLLTGYSYTRSGAKSELAASSGLIAFAANAPGIVPGVGYWSRGALTNLVLQSGGTSAAVTPPDSSATIATATTYTASRIFTRTDNDWVRFLVYETAATANRVSLWINLATGALGSLTAGGAGFSIVGSAVIVPLGTNSYRAAFSFQSATATAVSIASNSVGGDTLAATVGTHSGYALQIVAGNQAGPVIVTTGAAATVGADLLRMDGQIPTDESQIILVVVNIDAAAIAAQIGFIAITDGTNTNRIILYKQGPGNLDVRATLGGVEQTVTKPAVSGNISGRVAVLLRRSGGAWSFGYKKADGTTLMAASGAVGAFPTGLNRFDIGNRIGVEPANSPVEFVGIRRGTFSDAECLAILGAA